MGIKFISSTNEVDKALFDCLKACLQKLQQLTDLATIYFCFLSFNVNTFKIGFIVYLFCLYVYIKLPLVYQIACLTNLFLPCEHCQSLNAYKSNDKKVRK